MILIGAGGHARDIANTEPCDCAWHCKFDHHTDVPRPIPDGAYVIGINDPQVRWRVSLALGVTDCNWVHPKAVIGPGCWVGDGTHVNYGVTMTRTKLGHHCTVSPGATICGDVVVGDRVLIGAGSTICDRVTIGDDAVIGAGAVVLPESIVPAGETWVGVPARKVHP